MARCNNDLLLKKIGLNSLTENTEIDFRIRKDLADCRKINTKNYVKLTGTATYNKYDRPENVFECLRHHCVNTGTLTMAANAEATYYGRFDATEFAAGVITFYVKNAAQTVVTVEISDSDTFTNTDTYSVTLPASATFKPVVLDLSQTPSSDKGDGWQASAGGVFLRIKTTTAAGISSIAIFDSIEDFELNDVVTISCLTSIGGTFDLEVVEAQCQEAHYNDAITSLTYPITGTKATPNYWKLNPLVAKGKKVVGFDMATVKRTIENVGGKARVTIADLNQEVCGFIAVQLDDSCDVTDAALTQVSVPGEVTVALGASQYQVDTSGEVTYLYFSSDLVGMDVLVRYPRIVEIEEMTASPEHLGDVHVSMVVPHIQSDGVKLLYVFENVYVTSFPATITDQTGEFSFTITIGRDDDNNFYRIQRVVGNENSNPTIY